MTTSTLSKAEYMKAWRDANPEKVKAWQKANPEKIKAAMKTYRKNNPETVAASSKVYREANREKIEGVNKAYYENNREIIAERSKSWYKAHPYQTILKNMSIKCKVSMTVINKLVPQELIEVKMLQIQLRRLIYARAEAS